jgi:hypothetical protein
MRRKLAWGAMALLVVAAIGFFGVAPGWVDRDMNRIDGSTAGRCLRFRTRPGRSTPRSSSSTCIPTA